MPTAKPKRRFVYVTDSPYFEFDDRHRAEIKNHVGSKASADQIEALISRLQQQMRILIPERKIELDSPRPQEVVAAINRFKKKAEKLANSAIEFQESISELDIESRKLLRRSIPDSYDENDLLRSIDTVAKLESDLSRTISNLNEFDRIQFKSGRPKEVAYRRFASELAENYLDCLGLMPTKSRTGVYGKILVTCLKVGGHLRSDYFSLIKDGVDHINSIKSYNYIHSTLV